MKKNLDWQLRLVDLLFTESYMNLSTSKDNVPWSTPLVYACDELLRFYWVSDYNARHSKNIDNNPYGAISIYNNKQAQNSAEGIYIEGPISEINEIDLIKSQVVNKFYGWRYRDPIVYQKKLRPVESFTSDSPRRFYQLKPESIYGLDPQGDPKYKNLLDFRVQIDIVLPFKERYFVECNHIK